VRIVVWQCCARVCVCPVRETQIHSCAQISEIGSPAVPAQRYLDKRWFPFACSVSIFMYPGDPSSNSGGARSPHPQKTSFLFLWSIQQPFQWLPTDVFVSANKSGRGVKLTTHHLVPRLLSGATPHRMRPGCVLKNSYSCTSHATFCSFCTHYTWLRCAQSTRAVDS
jgi:hypothetical protein